MEGIVDPHGIMSKRHADAGAIARDLAHRMDGEVSIASKVGAGTTASVLLPAA